MEIIDQNNKLITLGNDKEQLVFFNLARKDCNYNIGDKTEYWKLYHYTKKVKDDLFLTVDTTFNKNGTYHSMSFGYHKNHLIRRTLEFNEEGNMDRDYLFFFNPLNTHDLLEYDAVVLPNMPIEDYIKEEHIYKINKYSFKNNILPDSIIEEFLDYNEYYGKLITENEKDKIKLLVKDYYSI